MVCAEVKVINESGLHLRPAGVLTQTCIRFKSEIVLYYGERKIIGKSVLNVMAAGVKKGSMVRVECSGVDEEEALDAVVEAISSGLGEGSNPPKPLF
jgi:phosphocarrier,  HPr family